MKKFIRGYKLRLLIFSMIVMVFLLGTYDLHPQEAYAQVDSSSVVSPSSQGGSAGGSGGGSSNVPPRSSEGSGDRTKKKTQVLNFEDELIEGANQKPELFYLFQRKNFNYKRLIKLRENFIPEMRKTSEDIQHNRSGN